MPFDFSKLHDKEEKDSKIEELIKNAASKYYSGDAQTYPETNSIAGIRKKVRETFRPSVYTEIGNGKDKSLYSIPDRSVMPELQANIDAKDTSVAFPKFEEKVEENVENHVNDPLRRLARDFEYFNENRDRFESREDYSNVKLPPLLRDYYEKNRKYTEQDVELNRGETRKVKVESPDSQKLLDSLKDFAANTEPDAIT
jgi:hypothetical protein